MHAHAHKVSVPGANSVLYEPLVHFRDVHPEDVGKDTASQARRSLLLSADRLSTAPTTERSTIGTIWSIQY
jgi:hypothetical protein